MTASAQDALVRCDGAARTYGDGPTATVALEPTTCAISAGDRVALVGPSGSEVHAAALMAGLDEPSLGSVTWPGIGDRSALRPGPVAIIFQGPSLLPPLTVEENVALPLILGGSLDREAHDAAREALDLLALAELADKLPEEISGGQAQRVAVARALAGQPTLILADEPTGQLDRVNGAAVVDVLLAAAAYAGAALVVSTHDTTVAQRLPEVWEMHSGRLTTTHAKGAAWSR